MRPAVLALFLAAMMAPHDFALARMLSGPKAAVSSNNNGADDVHGCPPNWQLFNRTSCFRVVDETNVRRTWEEAQAVCQRESGFLMWDSRLMIKDSKIRKSLLGNKQQHEPSIKKHTAWVGIRHQDGAFVWSDGDDHTSETSLALAMKTWTSAAGRHQEKRVKKLRDHCYLLDTVSNRLLMTNCTRKIQRFICQKDILPDVHQTKHVAKVERYENAECQSDSDWYQLGNATDICARMFFKEDEWKNWHDAQSFCRQQGGELASIHSSSENADLLNVVLTTIESAGDVGVTGFDPYIGLKRDDSGPDSATFVWSDGTMTDFDNWAPMEPSNYMGQESCVRMYDAYQFSEGQWNDYNCGVAAAFVCQICTADDCMTTDSPAPSSSPVPIGDCEEGWSAWGPSCFKAFAIDPSEVYYFTYSRAEENCRQNGAWLASIHSDEENGVVQAAAASVLPVDPEASEPPKAFIGFTDFIENAQEFFWDDQSPVDYTNWSSSEPDEFAADDCANSYTADCVAINVPDGKWSTEDCNLYDRTPVDGYICKKPAS